MIGVLRKLTECLIRLEQKGQDECYRDRNEEWNLNDGSCPGCAGGTWATDYISEMCCDCKHLQLG